MKIKIKPHKEIDKQIQFKRLHGMFPYKYYFSVLGTSKLGRIIAIVSNTELSIRKKKNITVEIGCGDRNLEFNVVMIEPAELNDEMITVYEMV